MGTSGGILMAAEVLAITALTELWIAYKIVLDKQKNGRYTSI